MSNKSWLARQRADMYVVKAAREGYRSRAAYKLKQIDERYAKPPLLNKGEAALEIGAAPGSWSQVMVQKKMRVAGVDLLPIQPLKGCDFVQGDFTEAGVQEQLLGALDGKADVILSDVSPNRSGHASRDESCMVEYVEASIDLSFRCLRPGGSFLTKLLQGEDMMPLLKRIKPLFAAGGALIKPPASRKASREIYLLCRGFKPDAADLWTKSRQRGFWWE